MPDQPVWSPSATLVGRGAVSRCLQCPAPNKPIHTAPEGQLWLPLQLPFPRYAGVAWLINQAGSHLLRYLPAAQGGSNRWDLPGGGCTDVAVSGSGLVAAVCRNQVLVARVTGVALA